MTNRGLTHFLLNEIPDFVWMTGHDIFLICEQQFPELTNQAFRGMFNRLVSEGYFAKRPGQLINHRQRGVIPPEYLRILAQWEVAAILMQADLDIYGIEGV